MRSVVNGDEWWWGWGTSLADIRHFPGLIPAHFIIHCITFFTHDGRPQRWLERWLSFICNSVSQLGSYDSTEVYQNQFQFFVTQLCLLP